MEKGYCKVPRELNRNRLRKGFDLSGGVSCKQCFERDRTIEKLRDELARAKQKIVGLEKARDKVTAKDVEGAHTPSAQKRFKKNASIEAQVKMGGAKPGHVGAGREKIHPHEAEETPRLPLPSSCPECQLPLEFRDSRLRSVLEAQPLRAKKVLYRCPRGVCPGCSKIYTATPTATPRSFYGNSLIAQAATLHFVHGMPLGKVVGLLGPEVSEGGLIAAFHGLGRLCEKALPGLTENYRQAVAKHADETGWRTDGHSGYAWIFCSNDTTLFEFRETRAARVAKGVLGEKPLPGVLIVDRYGGYNQMPCDLQYCYAHLLREVEKLDEEFPDAQEVTQFSSSLASDLTLAMKLRGRGLELSAYQAEARAIQARIEALAQQKFAHLGIKRIQQIFREKRHRLFHWVLHPEIPPDNNRAERELRPTVIARKVSFGSQSAQGAKTRSRIMSVLWTARKRFPNQRIEAWLTESLHSIARDPTRSFADMLRVQPPSTTDN